MKYSSTYIGVVFLIFACQQSAQGIDFVGYNEAALQRISSSIKSGKAREITQTAYAKLIKRADSLLAQKAPSVIDKTILPPSKNKHDYLSLSRYWWPDPSKKDGLPWIRKDGVTNPSSQTDDVDRNRLGLMSKMVSILSLAYYFTEDEKYAKKTASVLRVWFLDKETRMNPNLEYAQSVPGNPKGRRSGILDGRLIPQNVLDAIRMIASSSYWRDEDHAQMTSWLTQYLEWLTESKLGKAGALQTNNHGSWYNFQITALAYYLGDKALVTKMIDSVKQSYAFQFDLKGDQPHELQRTRSYFYSCFNLDAITRTAMISEKVSQSFWGYTTEDGKSISLAIDFLLPATNGADWPYKTNGVEPSYIAPILSRISKQSDNEKYPQLLHKILANLIAMKTDQHHDEVLFHFALFEPEFL